VYTQSPVEADKCFVHYMNAFNYLCGIRLTLKKAKLVRNQNPVSEDVFSVVRAEKYTTADATYSSESRAPLGNTTIFRYSFNNSFNEKGGYVQFFPGSLTGPGALEMFNNLKNNNWFSDNNTISLTTELMFFNAIYESGLYIAISFLIQNTGTANVTETVYGFQPQIYDSYRSQGELTLRYIFTALFQFLVFYEIIKLVIRFIYHAIHFFTAQRVVVPLRDFLDIVVLTFCIVSICYWYRYVFSMR